MEVTINIILQCIVLVMSSMIEMFQFFHQFEVMRSCFTTFSNAEQRLEKVFKAEEKIEK